MKGTTNEQHRHLNFKLQHKQLQTVRSLCRLVVFIYLLYSPVGVHEDSRNEGCGGGGRWQIEDYYILCWGKKGRRTQKTAYAPSNKETRRRACSYKKP